MLQAELSVDIFEAKRSAGNAVQVGTTTTRSTTSTMYRNTTLECTNERTRTSVKEAVSSRWESRAKASAEKKRGATLESTSSSGNSSSNPTDQKNKPLHSNNHNTNANGDSNVANSNTNPICQTWRHVQNAIGWRLLRHLAKEQKLHAVPKINQQLKQRSGPQSSLHQEAHNKKNNNFKQANKNKKSSGNLQNQMRLSQDKEKNKHRNREELAETIADLQATAALQNQLSDITNGESKHYLKSVLSILPAAYGFDERSALNSTIVLQNRKRAFLLMDLGRVIRAHAQFITMTCGFETRALNANAKARSGGAGAEMNLPPTHKLRRTGMNVNNVARTRRGVYIQPQFQVTKNPSMELLKLFARLGVDLRCNSSDDILAASQAVAEERRERHGNSNEDAENAESSMLSVYGEEMMPLVDDVSKTRKPNGYFRRLLQARSGHTAFDMSHVEVAVDGVDEVHRISNTVRTFAQRKYSSNAKGQKQNGCRFLLRLPSISVGNKSHDVDSEVKLNEGAWERMVLSVHEAAVEDDGELVGVSVDLTPWSNSLMSKEDGIAGMKSEKVLDPRAIIEEICTHLRLFRLLMLSVGQYHVRIDLTGLPYPLTREHCQLLTKTLKETVCRNVTVEELKQLQVSSRMIGDINSSGHSSDSDNSRPSTPSSGQIEDIVSMANNPSTCSLVFTADISHQLVARAGALCTRIIGVKASKKAQKEDEMKDSLSIGDDVDAAVAKHYYIDDGCYGSLGSSKCGSDSCGSGSGSVFEHVPVPMYGNRPLVKSFFRSLHPKLPSPSASPNSASPTASTPRSMSPSQDSKPSSLNSALNPSQSTGQLMQDGNLTEQMSNNCKNAKSTVWGPTCDGLDKVCDSIFLPNDLEPNRDWLVFSNLGCGGFGGGLGLGTAFNGFDPPDVAYCVLGYFSGATSSSSSS